MKASGFVGREWFSKSIVWLYFVYDWELYFGVNLVDNFYVQVNGLVSMLWVGLISIQKGWIKGLIYVVRDLQIALRMLEKVQSQFYVAQRGLI